MPFLSHIFLSVVFAISGLFGHGQPTAVVPVSTMASAEVSHTASTTDVVATSSANNPVGTSVPVVMPTTALAPVAAPVISLAPTTHTTPNGAVIDSNGNVITPAPPQPTAPAPPPNSKICNGTYYTPCPAEETFICSSNGGTAYCSSSDQQYSNTQTSQSQNQLQPSPQIEMNTFLSDANNALTTLENSSDCTGGTTGATCIDFEWGEGIILKLQTFGNALENQYRSAYCDYQVYSPLDQAIQTTVQAINDLTASTHTYMGTASDVEGYDSQVENLTITTDSNDESQAKIAAETCS